RLHLALTEILERRRILGLQTQGFIVRAEGFLVALLVTEGVAEAVPRLGEVGAGAPRGPTRRRGALPLLPLRERETFVEPDLGRRALAPFQLARDRPSPAIAPCALIPWK